MLVIYLIGGAVTIALGGPAKPLGSIANIATRVIAFSFIGWDLIVVQGQTGQCFGKSLMGIRCASDATGEPIGPSAQLKRLLAHILDFLVLGLGWFRPLWSPKRQTIADTIVGTVVVLGPKKNVVKSLASLILSR